MKINNLQINKLIKNMTISKIFIHITFMSLLLICQHSFTQIIEQQIFANENQPADTNKLVFNISNSNFVKDNEYFNKIVEGYTLIGYWVTPTLEFRPAPKTSINAGVHLLYFSGLERYYKVLPVFSFTQQLKQQIDLVLGTIKQNASHGMPEPLYSPENFYFKQVENGMQFLVNYSKFRSDTWLSWDNFIWYGDTVQEKLTFGSSNNLVILENSGFSLSIPLYAIITHTGGQINRPKKPIETLINYGSGLCAEFENENGFIQTVKICPQFFTYQKPTSFKSQVFKNGWAVNPFLSAHTKSVFVKLSWWYSEKFISPWGEDMYQSVSIVTPGYYEKHRSLIISKIAYVSNLFNCVIISAGFEGYYVQKEKLFDYNFSIQLNYRGRFLLKK
jgi:hypothetical protein